MKDPLKTVQKRADARRNRNLIIDAALACIARDSEASMVDVAQAAGVSRATLYGHFSSRKELIEAVFQDVMQRTEEQLAAVDLNGDPAGALSRLISLSWKLVDQHKQLLAAAEQELKPDRIRTYNDQPMTQLQYLVDRGRREGRFRDDQPVEWQMTCIYAILHEGAAALRTGRLTEEEAVQVVPDTIIRLVTT